jgi:hypothetical protein
VGVVCDFDFSFGLHQEGRIMLMELARSKSRLRDKLLAEFIGIF